MNRINQLSAERSELYRQRGNGRRRDANVLRRIHEVDREVNRLWDERRRERAGRLEGIDRLIDSVYQRVYGPDYDDAVSPLRVNDEEEMSAVIAAS